MQIKTLIKQLKGYDENKEIFLASDGEGNEIQRIHEVAHIEVSELSDDENDEDGGKVVIWPV